MACTRDLRTDESLSSCSSVDLGRSIGEAECAANNDEGLLLAADAEYLPTMVSGEHMEGCRASCGCERLHLRDTHQLWSRARKRHES